MRFVSWVRSFFIHNQIVPITGLSLGQTQPARQKKKDDPSVVMLHGVSARGKRVIGLMLLDAEIVEVQEGVLAPVIYLRVPEAALISQHLMGMAVEAEGM